MDYQIVECIPNFSEARRPDVINKIRETIARVPETQILDQHSDNDHNRTVITFVGPPKAVEEAAFQAIETAAKLIDLNMHTGEHPRIGATDVVPFVPIQNITMQECITIAQRLGNRVGHELNIPVYLYEEAATRPERQNLANIRRGEYEGLKIEIGNDPSRKPDFGPAKIGPAGAIIIGARQPLIAFNVFLTTSDVEIAKKVARAVRYSSGGLAFVKAMGLMVSGRAQVSMNLTNYKKTPVFRIVEMIRREAMRYGVSIHHSELVGMIPQEALVNTAVWYLQLDEFEIEQILEQRLTSLEKEKVLNGTISTFDFLDELASDNPTPAGGSASAHTAAEAASLLLKVGKITFKKKKYNDVQNQMLEIIDQANQIKAHLVNLVQEDSTAYNGLIRAKRLPKDSLESIQKRDLTIQEASLKAANTPFEVAKNSLKVLNLALDLVKYGNSNAIADVVSAASLAQSALFNSCLNSRINLSGMKGNSDAQEILAELENIEKNSSCVFQEIMRNFKERINFEIPLEGLWV